MPLSLPGQKPSTERHHACRRIPTTPRYWTTYFWCPYSVTTHVTPTPLPINDVYIVRLYHVAKCLHIEALRNHKNLPVPQIGSQNYPVFYYASLHAHRINVERRTAPRHNNYRLPSPPQAGCEIRFQCHGTIMIIPHIQRKDQGFIEQDGTVRLGPPPLSRPTANDQDLSTCAPCPPIDARTTSNPYFFGPYLSSCHPASKPITAPNSFTHTNEDASMSHLSGAHIASIRRRRHSARRRLHATCLPMMHSPASISARRPGVDICPTSTNRQVDFMCTTRHHKKSHHCNAGLTTWHLASPIASNLAVTLAWSCTNPVATTTTKSLSAQTTGHLTPAFRYPAKRTRILLSISAIAFRPGFLGDTSMTATLCLLSAVSPTPTSSTTSRYVSRLHPRPEVGYHAFITFTPIDWFFLTPLHCHL